MAAHTHTPLAAGRLLVVLAAIALVFTGFMAPAGAQSGGCANGPHEGATVTDSDGDVASDAVEVVAGTDECDPTDTPVEVCGEWIADYDASTADSDNDGYTDADEDSAGTNKCDSTSVIAATGNNTNAQPPLLALTGPSASMLLTLSGLTLVLAGFASLAIGRRSEA